MLDILELIFTNTWTVLGTLALLAFLFGQRKSCES